MEATKILILIIAVVDSEIQTAAIRTTREIRITKVAVDSEIKTIALKTEDLPQEASEILEVLTPEELNLHLLAEVSAVAVSETAVQEAKIQAQLENKTVVEALDRTIINNDYK